MPLTLMTRVLHDNSQLFYSWHTKIPSLHLKGTMQPREYFSCILIFCKTLIGEGCSTAVTALSGSGSVDCNHDRNDPVCERIQ
jgi:hypothetical protein